MLGAWLTVNQRRAPDHADARPATIVQPRPPRYLPMRVLFVTNMWPDAVRPWYGSFVRSQAYSLERIGVEVRVLAIRGYASAWEYVRGTARTLLTNLNSTFDVV